MSFTSYLKNVSNSGKSPKCVSDTLIHSLVNEKDEPVGNVDVQELVSFNSDEKSFDHIFQDPNVAKHYRELYDRKQYECRHLFDPELTWIPQEERKILWKTDFYVTFWAFLMFLSLDIDRTNISLALSDNMLNDLGLTTDDFNLGSTINLVCFLAAELPSQLISKWIGPDRWIPIQMCLWSVVAMCQGAIKGKGGFLVTRALIGVLQGGFLPDVCLWMSYFYTSKELPTRISLFYVAKPVSQIVSSLLAFALLRISTSSLSHGWRWLFLIEGAGTFLFGVVSFFKLPASVVETKAWYRKKGWYTDREEKILVNKVLRDDPQKGDMHNREPIGPKQLYKALTDFDLWPIYFIRLLGDIGTFPVSAYLTLTLRKLGFSTFKTNALTIPYNIGVMITMLSFGWATEFFNQRAIIMGTIPLWILAGLFPLRYWPEAQIDVWGTYILLTVLLAHCPFWAITISWCSANSNSVRSRAVSAAIVNICSQAGGIISANIYREDDKPLYHRGNTQLIGIAFGTLGACVFAKIYYVLRNKRRERIWNGMSSDEKDRYIQFSTDEGNKRLDFRFVH